MKSRPIILRGGEVRTIIDGRKTQLRRPIKPQPILTGFTGPHWPEHTRKPWMPIGGVNQDQWKCPYGQPGDRLWVRETWANIRHMGFDEDLFPLGAAHKADCKSGESLEIAEGYGVNWRPSIHMPRWASRITLEIVRIRVERVQDITNEDCWHEGMSDETNPQLKANRKWFSELWEETHGKEAWTSNPWVWVVEFRRVKK